MAKSSMQTDKEKLAAYYKEVREHAIENCPDLKHEENYLAYRMFIERLMKYG